MYIPTPQQPDGPADPGAAGPAAAGEPKPLQLFSRNGFVSPDAEDDEPEVPATDRPLVPLGVATGIALVLHGLLLAAALPAVPAEGAARTLLVIQWLVGSLLVLPVGLFVHRLTGRTVPALLAAGVVVVHPGVLDATLTPGGPFWALAAAAVALFLLFGGETGKRDGRRPVPGVLPSAAAGLVLGAGGLIALPIAALAVPLGVWRLLHGLGSPRPGRGPSDAAAAVVLVVAAGLPLAGFHAADGRSDAASRLQDPHGDVVPRLIESRWPTLLGRFGLTPGLDPVEEVRLAFEGPPVDGGLRLGSQAERLPAFSALDHAVSWGWTGLNALLLVCAVAAAGLALHRRQVALGLLLLGALPVAVVCGGVSGEALRLTLLPLQLLVLGVFWLPARRLRGPAAAFDRPVADAGFRTSQNTPRVL